MTLQINKIIISVLVIALLIVPSITSSYATDFTLISMTTNKDAYYLDDKVTITFNIEGTHDDNKFDVIINHNGEKKTTGHVTTKAGMVNYSFFLPHYNEGTITLIVTNSDSSIIETEFYYYDYSEPLPTEPIPDPVLTSLTTDKTEYYMDDEIILSWAVDNYVEPMRLSVLHDGVFEHFFSNLVVVYSGSSTGLITGSINLETSGYKTIVQSFYAEPEGEIQVGTSFDYYDYERPTITSLTTDKDEYYLGEPVIYSGTTTGNPSSITLEISAADDTVFIEYLVIPVTENIFSGTYTFLATTPKGTINFHFVNPDGTVFSQQFYYYNYELPSDDTTPEQIAFDNAQIALNEAYVLFQNVYDALLQAQLDFDDALIVLNEE